jgi:GNAT superfamily N-acetyltransferase
MSIRANLLNLISQVDLAPGEAKARAFHPASLDVAVIHAPNHPLLHAGYAALWEQFGRAGEMEERAVIERRLLWDAGRPVGGYALAYEMILVRDPAQGMAFAAVRDHTAIVPIAGEPRAVVHLSHVLVAPPWRGGGLAGWLRAWPIAAARRCLAAAGKPEQSPITLVAEMEHPRADQVDTIIRLKAYGKAGFVKVDQAATPYLQPDFRPPAEIDATSVRPLPMGLILRRVGREQETTMTGRELRDVVTCLYGMYAAGFRAQDIRVVYDVLAQYPADDVTVALVPPIP